MGEASESRELLPVLAEIPGHLLWRATARVNAAAQRLMTEGVDVHAYAVLLVLGDDGAHSQQQLADCVAVSRTTLTRVAGDLAAAGLVARERNPEDRRSYVLTRTPAGARATEEWAVPVSELSASITASFSAAERGELRDLLQVVAGPELDDTVPPMLRQEVAFLVTRAHQRAYREASAALAPLGLEPRHLGTLAALGSLGPVPQARLSHAIGVTPPVTVEIVDRLEELGLVERRRSETDRRSQEVHLTERAAEARAEITALAGDVVARVLDGLDPPQRRRLIVLLQRLVTAP